MTRRWWRRSRDSADEPEFRPGGDPAPAITRLDVGPDLVLEPAGPEHLDALHDAAQDDLTDLFTSMPWLRRDLDLRTQLHEMLLDVAELGRWGGSLHWLIHRPSSGQVLGLVGLDRAPRTPVGDWNLGYWVRRQAQRQGLARRSTDRVLHHMRSWDRALVLEISVDPGNAAGLATCAGILDRWGGERHTPGDGFVELDRGPVLHLCHLVRFPTTRQPPGQGSE